MDDGPNKTALCLAGLLVVAGAAHFVVPRSYQRIVPGILGDAAFWVRWSGVAEIGCGVLVAHPRTRRVGALAAAGLFVAVFPANVKMAVDGGLPAGLAWARLPLQIPLVWWAWRVANHRHSEGSGRHVRKVIHGPRRAPALPSAGAPGVE